MKKLIIKLFKHPLGIYLVWIAALIIFCIIGIPILGMGYSEGEQEEFTLLAYTLSIANGGFILLSLISPIVHWKWYKRYMYIPLVIPVTIFFLIMRFEVDVYIADGYHYIF